MRKTGRPTLENWNQNRNQHLLWAKNQQTSTHRKITHMISYFPADDNSQIHPLSSTNVSEYTPN